MSYYPIYVDPGAVFPCLLGGLILIDEIHERRGEHDASLLWALTALCVAGKLSER